MASKSALTESDPELTAWESLVCDALGSFIDFWGFKENQGRLWALLYLRRRSMSSSEIQQALGLSKGAVSMLTRELEAWGVILRRREAGALRYEAETDLKRMVGRVIHQREAGLLARMRENLEQARALAEEDGEVPEETLERIENLLTLTRLAENALELFGKTARLDFEGAFGVLSGQRSERKKRRRRR